MDYSVVDEKMIDTVNVMDRCVENHVYTWLVGCSYRRALVADLKWCPIFVFAIEYRGFTIVGIALPVYRGLCSCAYLR